MRILLLFLLFLSSNTLNAQTTVGDSMLHNGIMRYYSYYVPAIYNGSRAFPLVFNLHGYNSAAWQQSLYGDFKPIADTAGFIVVHPDGSVQPGTSSTQYWNVGFFASTVDDVDFIEQIIDTISSRYYINHTRVYSTGMSNGGFMSFELACSSERFSAIASVTGSMTLPFYNSCNPSRPMPVMQIHGTADPTVPYNGNLNFLHVDSVVNFWVNHNNCLQSPTFDSIPDIVSTDNARAEHYVWSSGDSSSSVEFYKVLNGGHTWPGTSVIIGVTCQDFSASKEIWRFFSQYGDELPLAASLNRVEEATLKIWPNPSNDFINISIENENEGVVNIYSFDGRKVISENYMGNQQRLDISVLTSGIYIFEFISDKNRINGRFVKR